MAGLQPWRDEPTWSDVIALLGNLTRDLLPGKAPRVGGGPFHCARALRRLEVRGANLRAVRGGGPRRADPAGRRRSGRRSSTCRARRPPSSASPTTATVRHMRIDDARRPVDARGRARAPRRGAVGARRAARALRLPGRDARCDRARARLSFDGQGLVRVPETGELRLDADYDPELLRASVDAEAERRGGRGARRSGGAAGAAR